MIRGRDVWTFIKGGKEGALIGLIGGYAAYFIIHAVSPGTFGLFSASPPSVVEAAFQTVVPYKPQIFMMLFGMTAGWLFDVLIPKRWLGNFARWVKT